MSRTINVNKYGYPLTKYPAPDEAWHWYEHFYLVDEATPDTVYRCFTDGDERVIWREQKQQDVTTLMFTWGSWNDRANLTYYPINGACPVTVADDAII